MFGFLLSEALRDLRRAGRVAVSAILLVTLSLAALARAIARKPLLLLADEPTGNLDDAMAAEVVDIVKDIWAGGTTVLFATHQAGLAEVLGRRTLTLEAGRIVKDEG